MTKDTSKIINSAFNKELKEGHRKSLPKYRQLSETILSLVESGYLEAGDRLPPENVLSNRLPISLGTIQKALRDLVELGVIKRTPKKGTIITGRSREISAIWQFRFIDENENSVFPIFSKVFCLDRVQEAGPWSVFLGNERRYLRIGREIDIDHRFKVISYFYLSDAQFGSIYKLGRKALEGVHLSAVIQRNFGISTIRTNNRVMCSAIPDPICLKLELPSAARGLICQIQGFGPNDKPISLQEVYIPADVQPMEFRELHPTWSSF